MNLLFSLIISLFFISAMASYPCIHCNNEYCEIKQTFSTVNDLHDHYSEFHPKCKEVCRDCHNKFKQKSAVDDHLCVTISDDEDKDKDIESSLHYPHPLSQAEIKAKENAIKMIQAKKQKQIRSTTRPMPPPVNLLYPAYTSVARDRILAFDRVEIQAPFDLNCNIDFPGLEMHPPVRRRFSQSRQSADVSRSYASFVTTFSRSYSGDGSVPFGRTYSSSVAGRTYASSVAGAPLSESPVSGNRSSSSGYFPLSLTYSAFISSYALSCRRYYSGRGHSSPNYSAFNESYASTSGCSASGSNCPTPASGSAGPPSASGSAGPPPASGSSSPAPASGGPAPASGGPAPASGGPAPASGSASASSASR